MITQLARHLREARTQQGFTQQQLANQIGVTRLTVTRWEMGQTTPTPYYHQRICELLQLSPTILSDGSRAVTVLTPLTEQQVAPDQNLSSQQHNGQRQDIMVPLPSHLSETLTPFFSTQLHDKQLDLQMKYLKYLIEAIDIFITHLEPHCDPELRKQATYLLLTHFQAQESSAAWTLPTIQHVKTMLDLAREQILAQQKALALTPILEISLENLKEVLYHLDDPTFLQDCALSRTHYVLSQLHGDESMAHKAQLVRDLLKNTFEHLQGSGVRSDTAFDWQHYNILYYCYFKHHLRNEQVAARLGFSTRTFFRQREHALHALLQVLLELDATSQYANDSTTASP